MMHEPELRCVVQSVIEQLVDEPRKCCVTETTTKAGSTKVLTVSTATDDVGKVIGRQGKTAKALRTIVEAMAAKRRERVMLEIDDTRKVRRNRHARPD